MTKTTYTAELGGKTFTRKSANGYAFAVILVTEDADKVRAHMARNFAAEIESMIKGHDEFNESPEVASGEWTPMTEASLHGRMAECTARWGARAEAVTAGPTEAVRWSRTRALAVSATGSAKLQGNRWEGQRFVIVPVQG